MPERWGTIFEVLKTKAIRHRVREQDGHTACGLLLDPAFHMDHDLTKEARCKKCYPKPKKAKPWLTSSKKK